MTTSPVTRARTRVDSLAERRSAYGWTVTELARRAGVPRHLLYRVERGEISLPPYALLRVALALDCTPYELTEIPDADTNPVQRPFQRPPHGEVAGAA